MKVADLIWQRLKQETDTVFFLPGGGCGPLVDALGQSGLNAVCTLHEQGAGFAAVAYAQHRGFGVALVTSGPGATNIMTPCLAAWTDSIPLLIISGQVMIRWLALDGMRCRGTQEGPTIEMVKPMTKYATMPRDGNTALDELEKCIVIAKDGRQGPTWYDACMDIQGKETE